LKELGFEKRLQFLDLMIGLDALLVVVGLFQNLAMFA
jgi:hypothetical protein